MYFILFYKVAPVGLNTLHNQLNNQSKCQIPFRRDVQVKKQKPADPHEIHKLGNCSEGQNRQEMWASKERIEVCYIKWSYLVRGRSDSDWPQWEQDAISHKDADHPDDGEAEADVAEILVGSGEEVPRGQFLWGEALRHLVVHDALQALLAEVEGVTQCKLPRRQRLGTAQLLHFLLHRSTGALDDAWVWQKLTVRPARWLVFCSGSEVWFMPECRTIQKITR